MLHEGLLDLEFGLLVGGVEGIDRAAFHRAQRTQRDRNPEELLQHRLRTPPAEVVHPGQQDHRRHELRAKGRIRDLIGVVVGTSAGSASRTFDLVAAPLRQVRTVVAQVDLLVPQSVRVRRIRQTRRAPRARRREEVDELEAGRGR